MELCLGEAAFSCVVPFGAAHFFITKMKGEYKPVKAIVCEMCGSQDLVKQDGYYVCQNCGTKYDPEEAKKLMVEVSGTVEVDNSKKLENYYRLARRAKEDGNIENAEKYYGLILEEEPNSWEANFYQIYFQCMNTTIGNMDNACYKLSNALPNIFHLVSTADIDVLEKNDAYLEIYSNCSKFTTMITSNILSASREISVSDHETYKAFIRKHVRGIVAVHTALGDECNKIGFNSQALEKYKMALDWNSSANLTSDQVNSLVEKIKTIEPDFVYETKKETSNSGGCYVATAVYGSYDCPQVWTLRRYRDYTLAETWYGRAFIRTYYAVSPTLVRFFGETDWFKDMWKPTLDRIVRHLNAEGVSNTPYQDRNW